MIPKTIDRHMSVTVYGPAGSGPWKLSIDTAEDGMLITLTADEARWLAIALIEGAREVDETNDVLAEETT